MTFWLHSERGMATSNVYNQTQSCGIVSHSSVALYVVMLFVQAFAAFMSASRAALLPSGNRAFFVPSSVLMASGIPISKAELKQASQFTKSVI